MSYGTQSQANATIQQQYRGILEILLSSAPITASCCVFLLVNGTMLYILRSKAVFRETACYVLLYNLLFADTIQMVLSQLLYILSVCRIRLTYPVCGFVVMLANLTTGISPLTLVVMSLERYIAVCYPLRHASIVTIRKTALAIIIVWAVSSLNVFIRLILLLNFPFEDLESLQMKDFCSNTPLLLGPMSDHYDKAYTWVLFVSAGVAVTCSYIGVMIAARSASTDKVSARKVRNTLLLHLIQLALSLSSTIYDPLVAEISKVLDRVTVLRIWSILYVFMILFPRCLSPLIYGIRDQMIRGILMYHLCCRIKTLSNPSNGQCVKLS